MASKPSVFFTAIERIITNWSAIQLALDHGMGGPEAAEKVQWMIGVIEQFFQENDNLRPEEVEDYIAEILDNEFDTVAEDGSLIEISRKFCNYFRLCESGREGDVLTAICKLPTTQHNQSVVHQASDSETSPCRLQVEADEQISGQLDNLSLAPTNMELPAETKDLEADEWTVVHRGKRR